MPDLADMPGNVLRIERRFDGPPGLIFALWTRPELVSVWFASSHGFRAEVHEMDLRPGGRWRLTTRRGTEAVEHTRGVYHEVVPGRRLLYAYTYPGTDFFSVVSVDLAPDGSGTRMRFCQTGFPDAESFREHSRGWGVVVRLFEGALLAGHGIGAHLPSLPEAAVDGVARDLEAARQRYEAERKEAAE